MKLHIVGTPCNEYVSLNCFSGNQSISDFDDQLDETETINICKPEKRNGGSEEDSVCEYICNYTFMLYMSKYNFLTYASGKM